MPTYDYECSNGHEFERFQSITAAPLTACPTCGGVVRRLIGGGTGIIFKGSGFYVTDSKNGGRANGAPNQEKDADKAAAGDAKDGSKESTTAKDAKPSGSESTGSASKGGDGGAQPTKDPKPAATTS